MEVKIKKLHKDAVIPTYANNGDAGLDLTAISAETDKYGNIVYHFGLAFEIPEGYVGLIFPRSSICKKTLSLTNSVAVIDSCYRGEVTAKFKQANPFPISVKVDRSNLNNLEYEVGDRVAQMIILPYPKIEFKEVDELSETERGTGGYGSTGK